MCQDLNCICLHSIDNENSETYSKLFFALGLRHSETKKLAKEHTYWVYACVSSPSLMMQHLFKENRVIKNDTKIMFKKSLELWDHCAQFQKFDVMKDNSKNLTLWKIVQSSWFQMWELKLTQVFPFIHISNEGNQQQIILTITLSWKRNK